MLGSHTMSRLGCVMTFRKITVRRCREQAKIRNGSSYIRAIENVEQPNQNE
ncbi:hypothetical protein DPMN_052592 [Dreissena polymorpha]|uniref:Uncharacterized protein n=1 Tax=Dreissena polymorpha TaxID=45954 RepID=A0A9D4CJY3_DREPO|nr:hypothetical protein DPMN_052592 [Dreissena polymorpha]